MPNQVVIIEDHEDAREALVVCLRSLGLQVAGAANGAAGLRLAIDEHPSVIVVDISLPDASGYDIARRIRAECGPEPFLIALTGHSRNGDREEARDAGFDRLVRKPADPDTIGRLVRDALTPSPGTGAA